MPSQLTTWHDRAQLHLKPTLHYNIIAGKPNPHVTAARGHVVWETVPGQFEPHSLIGDVQVVVVVLELEVDKVRQNLVIIRRNDCPHLVCIVGIITGVVWWSQDRNLTKFQDDFGVVN